VFDKNQFRDLIQRTLSELGIPSRSATELLIGTCAQESQMGTYLRQINGPALGCMQVEPSTFQWLWMKYYLRFPVLLGIEFEQMEYDLRSSIIMARLKYLSCPGAIPATLEGQAGYWKRWYNSPLGAGTVEEYISNYRKYCV
jgi:hypothetical protein